MMIKKGSCIFPPVDEEEKRCLCLEEGFGTVRATLRVSDVRLVLCVWGASIAYSQSLVILMRMFEWCSIVGVLV